MTAAGAHTADLLLAADLLDQAKQITRLRPGFSIDSTLWHFANLVQAASASPNFALGRADLAIADTHQADTPTIMPPLAPTCGPSVW